ncbi:hematopoietically-expressed homeobox protein HHEX homolog [Schistocerca cancellata]|uniref:hematopoietically-expressed homeobox protein HHEX homolog n=1 Tax=Schistocerca cancellata TaxID=274614 RepID=UPI0021197C1D|nr:hematopoietically-expressed homeobox protein HHEX homolog [Schistocerca cancellata]
MAGGVCSGPRAKASFLIDDILQTRSPAADSCGDDDSADADGERLDVVSVGSAASASVSASPSPSPCDLRQALPPPVPASALQRQEYAGGRFWSPVGASCHLGGLLSRHHHHHQHQHVHAKRKGGQVRFTTEQTAALERRFCGHKYLSPEERRVLAAQLSLSDRQVKTWFQNRRAKWRRASQASDCNGAATSGAKSNTSPGLPEDSKPATVPAGSAMASIRT